MKVGVFARGQVPTIDSDEKIPLALWTMTAYSVHRLPVVEDGDIVGVVTDGQIHIRRLFGQIQATTLVRDVMGARPVCCNPDDTVENAALRMLEGGVRRAWVIWPNGRSVGEVSLGELAGGIGDARLAARVVSSIFDRDGNGGRPVGAAASSESDRGDRGPGRNERNDPPGNSDADIGAGPAEAEIVRRIEMRAKVDPGRCDGTGVCEQVCPEVFKVNGDKAEVKVNEVPADAEDLCRQAMQGCPTEAISIEG